MDALHLSDCPALIMHNVVSDAIWAFKAYYLRSELIETCYKRKCEIDERLNVKKEQANKQTHT